MLVSARDDKAGHVCQAYFRFSVLILNTQCGSQKLLTSFCFGLTLGQHPRGPYPSALMENLKLLFQLYFRPASAIGEIIDKGSWLFASVVFLIVSFAFQYAVNSNILDNYAVSRFDAYRTQSNFEERPDFNGRLTPAQLEEAEY
jgi:hypothetical protein